MTDEAAPLCIDCGQNRQAVRHDGETGTLHRCDPCARLYLKHRRLRLAHGEWNFGAQPEPTRCLECGGDVAPGVMYFMLTDDPLCWPCARDSGWADDLQRAAPTAPVLASADLTVRDFEGPQLVIVEVPCGIPVLAATALQLMGVLTKTDELQGGIRASRDIVGEVSVKVSGQDDTDRVPICAAVAGWLTKYASRVTVPAALYRPIRDTVYESAGGTRARRLARQRPS